MQLETHATASFGNGSVDTPFEEVARRAVQLIGDVAVATRVLEEGLLLTVAVIHRDPSREPSAGRVLGERYRRGESLPGRVWESERGLLLVDVDNAALASIAPADSKAYVREIGMRSLMIVPLWRSRRVVGTLGVARDRGGAPYTEADFERFARLAVLGP